MFVDLDEALWAVGESKSARPACGIGMRPILKDHVQVSEYRSSPAMKAE